MNWGVDAKHSEVFLVNGKSNEFSKMRVKALKNFIADRGKKCVLDDGGPCIDKSEFVSFAERIQDLPIKKKMGLMEEKREEAKQKLKLFGWDDAGKGEVVHLVDDDLSGALNSMKTKQAMVFYYAEWCQGCKALKPHYVSTSQEVAANKDISCTLFAVECDMNPNTCQAANLVNFPTLMYYADAASLPPEEYKGDRGTEGVVKFLTNQAGTNEWENRPLWDENGQVMHITDKYFQAFEKKTPTFMMFFYAPWCGHCSAFKPTYANISNYLGNSYVFAAMDCVDNPLTCGKFNVDAYPSIKMFDSTLHGPPEEYEGDRSFDDLMNFLVDREESANLKQAQSTEDFLADMGVDHEEL